DQVAAGELVLELPRVHARREYLRRGDQVLSRPPHDALLAAAALLLAYQLDEAVLLELAHVVGHLLAREPQDAGHRRGRAGLGQRLQDPLPAVRVNDCETAAAGI